MEGRDTSFTRERITGIFPRYHGFTSWKRLPADDFWNLFPTALLRETGNEYCCPLFLFICWKAHRKNVYDQSCPCKSCKCCNFTGCRLYITAMQGHFSLPSFSLFLFLMLLFSFLKLWTVCLFTLDRSSSLRLVHLWRISYCSWLDCHSCALRCIIWVIIYLIDNVVPTCANLPEKEESQIIQAINQV